jgi:gamma-glutamylcyclotransferase (GGCT)/AIG2-like uncharacterized protein YtfP
MHLFAYGTLQNLQQLAAVLGPHVHFRMIGRGTICGMLYDVGRYPALKQSSSPDDTVPGVLLEIDDGALTMLDEYEDLTSGLYVRQRCDVRLGDASVRSAWVYLYNRPTAGLPRITAWPPPRD